MNNDDSLKVINKYESGIRVYCRNFPEVFQHAKMSKLYAVGGIEYIDFFSGAGVLNYGHNNTYIKSKIIDYLNEDGIIHALDMATSAKIDFITTFNDKILKPRQLDYKFLFSNATGTNAVEAALKLARKLKKRNNIFAFSGSFHGMTLGSLAVTSSAYARQASGVELGNVTFMPFPVGFNKSFDTIDYIENVLTDDHSGVSLPAAIILETVQAEGGIYVLEKEWLIRLDQLCKKHNILLICDDVQAGCGRTGTYFSFERAGIKPDIIVLSKSISGIGMPMSLVLFRPDIDVWKPGEHNGTFRGNQLGFVGAKAAIEYHISRDLNQKCKNNEQIINKFIDNEILPISNKLQHRGIGMIHGIDFSSFEQEDMCKMVQNRCFSNKLVIECAGRKSSVIKLLPPLVIEEDELMQGLNVIKESIQEQYAKINKK
jgi:diaminobutyrate-2-oxoglutarate transaminase